MFRAYCDKIGVAFETEMLKWNNEADENSTVFRQWLPWFEGALSSNTFQPAAAAKPRSPRVHPEELPRHVQRAIDDSYVYYRQMYDVRLRPPTLP